MMKCLLLVAAVAYASALPRIVDHSEGGYETYWETGGEIDSENNDSSSSFNSTNTYSGSRIIGGEVIGSNKYPFLVAIVNYDPTFTQYDHHCGGSLISHRHVVSAGHCFVGYDLRMFAVRLGSDEMTNPSTPVKLIDNITVHPDYLDLGGHSINDIAMITLNEAIVFSFNYQPVCLPSPTFDITGHAVTTLGWGWINPYGVLITNPKELHTNVINTNQCNEHWKEKEIQINPITQLCTKVPIETSCHGDSGGPVFWEVPQKNMYILVGVVSFGNNICVGELPNVHTRVAAYVPWIRNVMGVSGVEPTC